MATYIYLWGLFTLTIPLHMHPRARVAKSVGSEDPDPGTPMLAQEHFSGAHTFFEPFFRFQDIFFRNTF